MASAFKTAALRNVALRAPYMHAGEMQDMVAFLGTLSAIDERKAA